MRYCSKCRLELPDTAKFCKSCGQLLAADTAPVAAGLTCSACGASNREGAKFCKACGAAIGVPAAQVGPSPAAAPRAVATARPTAPAVPVAPVRRAPPPTPRAPFATALEPETNWRRLALIGGVAIVVLALAVGGWYLWQQQQTPKTPEEILARVKRTIDPTATQAFFLDPENNYTLSPDGRYFVGAVGFSGEEPSIALCVVDLKRERLIYYTDPSYAVPDWRQRMREDPKAFSATVRSAFSPDLKFVSFAALVRYRDSSSPIPAGGTIGPLFRVVDLKGQRSATFLYKEVPLYPATRSDFHWSNENELEISSPDAKCLVDLEKDAVTCSQPPTAPPEQGTISWKTLEELQQAIKQAREEALQLDKANLPAPAGASSEAPLTPPEGEPEAPAPTQTQPMQPQRDYSAVVAEKVSAANKEFEQGNYCGALQNSDQALSLDPKHGEAHALRNKVQQTINILGVQCGAANVGVPTKKGSADPSGVWAGTGYQDNGTTWPVRMKINDNWNSAAMNDVVGTVEYPSLQCGGELLKTQSGLRERLTYGKSRCVDGGTIVFGLGVVNGQTNQLLWNWYYPDGRLGARAKLVRE